MINFAELELKVNDKYSFVGIERKDSRLLFCLPKGLSQNDINSLDTFEKKRDLFFKFYRVFNIFKHICLEKGYSDNKVDDRDGFTTSDMGSGIQNHKSSENIFYSKVDSLGRILDIYDELKILGFVNRLGKSEKFDYSKLHRYLNQGIFLKNGSIYIDTINRERKEIYFEATDIVTMYCYILNQIQEQLKQELNPEIKALAERFKEKYLGSEYNLFSEKYYSQVINYLKDALELIDNYTTLKDGDYWDFYEAIEAFLFGDLDTSITGKIWGFNNFHSVWESLCLNNISKIVKPCFIIYLDSKFVSSQILNKLNKIKKAMNILDIFKVNDSKISPDAVIISSPIVTHLEHNQTSTVYTLKINMRFDPYPTVRDDQDYYTKFSHGSRRKLKIAFINQKTNYHTFNELKKFGKAHGTFISITSLPDNFYSYWDIDEDTLNPEEISMMYNLNHIFIVAFKSGFLDFEGFYKKYIDSQEVFKFSLLRDVDKQKINESYKKFIISNLELYFNIIDVKYAAFEYYKSSDNIEEIKRRSVRKQFVYEYLLQKHLELTNSPFKNLDIKSDFWLPVYSSESDLLIPGEKYLDDYIKLTGVNIMSVIESYLENEEL